MGDPLVRRYHHDVCVDELRMSALVLSGASVVCLSCAVLNPAYEDDTLAGSESTSDVSSDSLSGDGDGDPGDGDGDPGDGDPGDGDPGDGDGDPGDGDGDGPACEPPEVMCGELCVDLLDSDEHCGGCFDPCETGCLAGQCYAAPYKLLFVTSEQFNGALDGLAGADARCMNAAADAGLEGEYLAWLSDGTLGPAQRMEKFPGDYRLPNGVLVANSWQDLTNSTLIHPINADEHGEPGPDVSVCIGDEVWTNTVANGDPNTQNDCDEWTDGTPQRSSSAGRSSAVDATWTHSECSAVACSTELPLYCIQQ